jgi:hypothetical protein
VRKGSTSRAKIAIVPKVSFWPDSSISPGNYGWLLVF